MRGCWCLVLILLVLPGLVLGCGNPGTTGDGVSEKPLIVTTIYPAADITRRIGGDAVQVICLIPSGASPHTFEPTPRQMSQIAGAAAFIAVGAGLDDWAGKLTAAGGPDLIQMRLTDGLELRDGDPHIWLDPVLVRKHMVPAITRTLTELSPAHQAELAARAQAYQQELDALDHEIRDLFAGVENPRFIALHPAWQYFADRYDLVQAAAVEPAPGKEPSARWTAQVVETARDLNAKAIFAEPQFSTRDAQTIARESGAVVLVVDPLGGAGLKGKDNYIALMRSNAAVFRDGLK